MLVRRSIRRLCAQRLKCEVAGDEKLQREKRAAFIRQMDHMKVNYQFRWNLDEEQKLLFLNVGIGTELFMNN